MAQIVSPQPTWQEQLGSGLGQGISQGVQMLLQKRLQDMQQAKTASALEFLGVPKEIGMLPQEYQKEFFKNYLQRGGAFSGQQQQAMQMPEQEPQQVQQQQAPSIFDILKGAGQREISQMTPYQAMQMVTQPSESLQGLQLLASAFAPQQLQQPVSNALLQQIPEALQRQALAEPPKIKIEAPRQEQRAAPVAPAAPATAREKLAQTFAQPYESPELKLRRELAERQLAHQERIAGFKQTKELRKEISDKAKEARQNLDDIEELEELEKTGKLDTAGYKEFLARSGFDVPALLNPESQEYEKISTGFLRGAKNIFGGNVSNYEASQFLKLIPTLSMSPEGRMRVLSGLKKYERGNLEYNNTMKEVVDRNKGIPPLDLQEQIDDKIGDRLKEISKKFKEDIKRAQEYYNKNEDKLVTALQAGAGGLLGSLKAGGLKGAAKGALLGAAYGKTAGGPGVATGAGIGGLAGLLGVI